MMFIYHERCQDVHDVYPPEKSAFWPERTGVICPCDTAVSSVIGTAAVAVSGRPVSCKL